jgi:hypothetical protein
VVLVCFGIQWPGAWRALTLSTLLIVFINAVLANVAYCAAYPLDVVLQYWSFRHGWRRRRWYLLVIGTLFACAIAFLVATSLFLPAYGD